MPRSTHFSDHAYLVVRHARAVRTAGCTASTTPSVRSSSTTTSTQACRSLLAWLLSVKLGIVALVTKFDGSRSFDGSCENGHIVASMPPGHEVATTLLRFGTAIDEFNEDVTGGQFSAIV